MTKVEPLKFWYKNYKGKLALRSVTPKRVYWGKNEYHPEEQWLMLAYDWDRAQLRTFAMKDMDCSTFHMGRTNKYEKHECKREGECKLWDT